ncbi:MAG TPA: hypothetical protein VN047_11045 [Sphingopyxis sp.]|uniref:hypothetical protein n=1 Tax=Sphingopyxis sp. TaxID=1908224 RepID=UPI002BE9F3EE|nr:hypothetical protein [Sphingopyxis sp.]HWW57417.1 hypothetical protein [Sphingopyxis sp.]
MTAFGNPKKSEIVRSWSPAARQSNFRNFRFYPILVFALFCTLAPIAFVVAVISRIALGYSTGTAGIPGMLVVFTVAGAVFFVGQRALRLRDGGGPFLMAFIFGSGLRRHLRGPRGQNRDRGQCHWSVFVRDGWGVHFGRLLAH